VSKQYVQLVLRLEAKEGRESFLIEVKLVVSANGASVVRLDPPYALSRDIEPIMRAHALSLPSTDVVRKFPAPIPAE
jgi:hypothetical protein